MMEIARLPADDRRELFHNTAAKTGLHDAIVEKDFWVCLTLDYLFHRSPWKKSVTFKGGTSLSKGYHLISRFSEDIDLILDWRVLGYEINEPWEKRSNTKQDVFNKEANRKAEIFLAKTFCPQVREGLSAELGLPANLYIDEEDKQTMIFAYPNLFTDASTLQVIRLEIGALAAWTPAALLFLCPPHIRRMVQPGGRVKFISDIDESQPLQNSGRRRIIRVMAGEQPVGVKGFKRIPDHSRSGLLRQSLLPKIRAQMKSKLIFPVFAMGTQPAASDQFPCLTQKNRPILNAVPAFIGNLQF